MMLKSSLLLRGGAAASTTTEAPSHIVLRRQQQRRVYAYGNTLKLSSGTYSIIHSRRAWIGLAALRNPSNRVTSLPAASGRQAAAGVMLQAAATEAPLAQDTSKELSLVQLSPPDADVPSEHLLVYLPGTDGTGASILMQLDKLVQSGYQVWTLHMPVGNRETWSQLTSSTASLLRQLAGQWKAGREPSMNNALGTDSPVITLVGESFGGCLGLRVALQEPSLLRRLVLVNPATSYNDSLNGLSALVSSTNLLGVFPEAMYAAAQATLLPLLMDSKRITPQAAELMRSMIDMERPYASRHAQTIRANGSSTYTASSNSNGNGYANGNGNGYANGNGNGNSYSNSYGNGYDSSNGNGYSDYNGVDASGYTNGLNGNGNARFTAASTSAVQPQGILSGLVAGLPSYPPAAAANHRVNLLRDGNLSDEQLKSVSVPTLIISSARDRLLPSITEGARLLRLIGRSVRVILPDSGHAALLEDSVDLAAMIHQFQESPQSVGLAKETAADVTQLASTGAQPSGPKQQPVPAESAVGQGRLSAEQRGSRGAFSAAKAIAQTNANDAWTEWAQLLAPWRDLVSPVVVGEENLPPVGSQAWSRPWLFVGNHGRAGTYDTPLLMYELYVRGYKVRGLAHPGHWKGPFGQMFERFGAVKASPMAAFRLLRSNEKVLLFPGGAREVVKKRGEEYQLLWRESPDFVRMATKCKAIIMPFSAVGADDAFDVVMDVDEILENPLLGGLVRNVLQRVDPEGELKANESIFPMTRMPVLGLPSPVPVPNLTRLYFKFGQPIDTAELNLDLNDEAACQQLYDGIRESIKQDLAELLTLREGDSERDVQARIASSVSTLFSTAQNIAIPPLRSNSKMWE